MAIVAACDDVFAYATHFSDGEMSARHVGTVTPADCEGYILRNVVDKVPGWKGGTTYSYVLEKNLQHFGWLPCDENHGALGWISRFLDRTMRPGGCDRAASAL